MQIVQERPGDAAVIGELTDAAFQGKAYSSGTEVKIVDALRAADALTLSLVMIEDGRITGHAAFSPVTINSQFEEWYGLGPVSVWPHRQKQGIGQVLIRDGLSRLKSMGAAGCILVGDPEYYRRFGFQHDVRMRYRDIPQVYFQCLSFNGRIPEGEAEFHPAFDVE